MIETSKANILNFYYYYNFEMSEHVFGYLGYLQLQPGQIPLHFHCWGPY